MRQMLPFTKMHGLGNDFVVMDGRTTHVQDCPDRPTQDWPALARAICDRHFGVGADQLLLVCDSTCADVMMLLFNTDGFEAEMCGNGIRCIGKYVYEGGIVRKHQLSVETLGGIKHLRLSLDGHEVTGAEVAMGVPEIIFQDEAIQVGSNGSNMRLNLTGINMGNPHTIAFLDSPVAEFPLAEVGPLVERHPLFPKRTNFEIVNVISPRALRIRVWERSAGITLACGTGACATMAAARLKGLVADEVDVHLPGGTLKIAWDGEEEVMMTGPATKVFEGQYIAKGET